MQRAIAASEMADAEEARYEAVLAKAKQLSIPVRIDGPGNRVRILHDVRGTQPLYRTTLNANAAISTGANLIRQTAPYNLSGSGLKVGVWDGGSVRNTHQEFGTNRVVKRNSSAANDEHATHVAGTIGATGVQASAKGMAPLVAIDSYDWNSDYAEMTSAGAATATDPATRIPISNHSYGYGATNTDLGRYEAECRTTDNLANNLPFYLIFWAAGNEQQDYGKPYGGYQSITFNGLAKNIVTVGAANDAVSSGVRDVTKGTLASFSSMGPCDDGRIKPDIVANGVGVNSPVSLSDTSYDSTYSGTSMATPNAAGSATLLQQLYKTNFSGQLMRASMLKALLIHTADDVGRPGPDYQYGWGYMNAKASADLILAHKASLAAPKMIENSITAANKVRTNTFVWDGTSPIRATVVWTDPPGAAQTGSDSRTRNLVNDLDLKITAPDGTTSYLPYVMPYVGTWTTASITSNAVKGTNSVDNVERVDIPAPTQPGTYTVTVGMYGNNALTGTSQVYSLIVTGGASAEANPPPVVNITSPSNGAAVLPNSSVLIAATATDMAAGGLPGQVTKVEFFDGATLLGEKTSSPYEFNWTPTGSGARSITAKATDSQGATTVSSPVSVNVLAGDGKPTVAGFSPASGVAGDSVVITGNNLGVATNVRFGALAATFAVNSLSQITATVPAGAVSAPITVSNAYGSATTAGNFSILPVIFREDFSSITGGDSVSSSGSTSLWAGNTNFPTVSRVYEAGGAVKLGSSSAIGSMTTRAINLAGNGGAFSVSFKVKGWSSVEGNIKVTAGSQSQTVSYTAIWSDDFETKTLNFTGGTTATTIKIETTTKRAFIDDVSVFAEAPSLPPVITSPSSAGGLEGQAFSYQITASNSPTSFGATGLPAWASINTTSGVISGTPLAAGTNVAVISAANSAGAASTNLTITILPSGGGGGGGTTNTIFSENMGTPTGTTSIAAYSTNTAPATFQNKGVLTFGQGGAASPADVRTSTASTNYAGASGGGNIWFTTTSGAYGFSIEGINAAASAQLKLDYGYYKNSATAHATFSIDYWNGSAWVTVANAATDLFNESATAGQNWYAAKSLSLPVGAQINGLKLRFVKTGSNAIRIDDVKLTGVTSSSPSISATGSLSAVDTVYGTASANPTSFTVSGANLAAGITVSPPPGFEVSAGTTNAFAGQGNSIVVGSAGTVANTTVFVRLAADTDAGTYSGNIVCSSVGAESAAVPAVTSVVSAKPVSVAPDFLRKTYGNEDPELSYSSSESAPFSGAVARDAGENVGVYRIRQGDLTAGPNYSIDFTENNFEITRRNASVTANDITKPFGQTLPLGAGQTGFSASGLVNGETIGSVTITADGGTSANDAAGTYLIYPSDATGGTFSPSNYNIAYSEGQLTVTGQSFGDWGSGLSDPAPGADPDANGLPNLLEYFLGMQPGASAAGAMTIGTPTATSIHMDYRRSKSLNGVAGGVVWRNELTSGVWSAEGVTDELVSDHGTYEMRRATVPLAPEDQRKFINLEVQQQ